MAIVTYFVETASGYLDSAAETQFGAVAETVGTTITVAATLVVILVFVNMLLQVRPIDARTSFWLLVKITLVGVFATNWAQFNYLADAILTGIDSISGSLVASVGGGAPGPSGTFAEEFDLLIEELGDYLNAAGSSLNWMAGALLDTLGVVLLSVLGALAAFIMVASRLLITLMVGLAPIMIFLTLFEATKDYFTRWLSSLISFALYPVVVAGVFATIVGVADSLRTRLGDPADAESIGALIPFFMMVLMAKGFLLAIPFIVRSISGNVVMPAMTSGMGGSYEFARAAMGSQMARRRVGVGSASGAEIAGVRTRDAVVRAGTVLSAMPSRPSASSSANPASTGTAQKLQRMKDRADRLGK